MPRSRLRHGKIRTSTSYNPFQYQEFLERNIERPRRNADESRRNDGLVHNPLEIPNDNTCDEIRWVGGFNREYALLQRGTKLIATAPGAAIEIAENIDQGFKPVGLGIGICSEDISLLGFVYKDTRGSFTLDIFDSKLQSRKSTNPLNEKIEDLKNIYDIKIARNRGIITLISEGKVRKPTVGRIFIDVKNGGLHGYKPGPEVDREFKNICFEESDISFHRSIALLHGKDDKLYCGRPRYRLSELTIPGIDPRKVDSFSLIDTNIKKSTSFVAILNCDGKVYAVGINTISAPTVIDGGAKVISEDSDHLISVDSFYFNNAKIRILVCSQHRSDKKISCHEFSPKLAMEMFEVGNFNSSNIECQEPHTTTFFQSTTTPLPLSSSSAARITSRATSVKPTAVTSHTTYIPTSSSGFFFSTTDRQLSNSSTTSYKLDEFSSTPLLFVFFIFVIAFFASCIYCNIRPQTCGQNKDTKQAATVSDESVVKSDELVTTSDEAVTTSDEERSLNGFSSRLVNFSSGFSRFFWAIPLAVRKNIERRGYNSITSDKGVSPINNCSHRDTDHAFDNTADKNCMSMVTISSASSSVSF